MLLNIEQLKIEYENKPPTPEDIPQGAMEMFARDICRLMRNEIYKKYQEISRDIKGEQ